MQIKVGLEQFRSLKDSPFVGFETLRGLIDMLRFAGYFSVEYSGGEEFFISPAPGFYKEHNWADQIVKRFESFGIKAEIVR